MDIRLDDLTGEPIIALLEEHLRAMEATSPPESRHALDLSGLKQPAITFWTIWEDQALAGCGALRQIDPRHGEIKSMRTAVTHLRRCVASRVLAHLVDVARQRGYARLSLETGSMAYFEPARRLYASFGFEPCAPFGGYVDDPNSVFMTLRLDAYA